MTRHSNYGQWFWRTRRRVVLLYSLLLMTAPIHAGAQTQRCGWLNFGFNAMKPDEIAFQDSERIWRIVKNAGKWPLIRQSDMYPNTQPSYTYAGVRADDYLTCMCLTVEAGDDGSITKMSRAHLIPISRCLNDRKLWQPSD